MDELLAGLNKAQRAAVTSDAAVLQVLAPPGSGKTKTLTARVAHLITRGLKPWNIVVCTFTHKAAEEMQERIRAIVGEKVKSKLKIGTFHSIALQYLRHYRQEAGLKDNFGVADASDSLAMVKRIIKAHDSSLEAKQARNRISSHKSKAIDYNTYASHNKNKPEQQEFTQIWRDYQASLEACNLLDFDDILLRCTDVLQTNPECVSHVEAVLVDEFQDTNSVQYRLMELFAQRRQCITIVGDPDQSIYGWRSAEIKNLSLMKKKWGHTITINLQENYRSSGAILQAAQKLIEQDEHRPKKELQATHSFGHKPVLRRLPTAWNEASWIATEIRRFQGLSGKLLAFNDFAILLRSASLSRVIEQTFGKEGIPYRMVGGLRFYDRKEVQIILDYLRVIHAPIHVEALARVLNVPSRGIGDATIEKLQVEARVKKMTLWEVIVAVCRGQKKVNVKVSTEAGRGLARFMEVILTGQRKLEDDVPLVDLMYYLIKKINFEAYIKKTYSEDHENRWANVEELVAQAVDTQSTTQIVHSSSDKGPIDSDAADKDEPMESDTTGNDETPLCRFLANVSLASSADDESEEEAHQGGVVTISTIHAAKGLEWPIVFIPACFNGSIPHSRSEDHDEERRLLYVGMTRAQAMLYLSCPLQDSQKQETTLSAFLSHSGLKKYLQERGPAIRHADAISLSRLLRRDKPSTEDIAANSARLEREEDDWWPTNGERPVEFSEEAEAYIRNGEGVPVFGNTRSASWANGAADPSSFLRFSSVADRYDELTEKQDRLAQKMLDKRLNTAAKGSEQPRGRKRHIEGQGTISTFFGQTSKTETTPALRASASNTAMLRDITNVSSITQPTVDLPKMHKGVRMEPLRKRPRALDTTQVGRSEQPYVFLSSSPTRLDEDAAGHVKEEALRSVSPPQFKPATTLHTTSLGAITTVRRTLGVKRSLNGNWNWSRRKL